MALPASGPISMSMVAAEFEPEIGANMSLSASAALLSTPVASNIFLAASFYGQSAFSGTAFAYNAESQEDGAAACALEELEDQAYHDNGSGGGGTAPAAGDKVYTNSTGTIAVGDGVYKITGNQYMVIVSGNGTVQQVLSCGRSDRRLKRNIVFRTYSESGIPIYEFEYINKLDGKGRYVGTMAQDLIRLGKSEAVITDKEGFYLVDYSKIDVNFFKI